MIHEKESRPDVLQLVVLNLSPEPAVDVSLRLDPLPEMWKDRPSPFPLVYPVVDRATPIEIDLSSWFQSKERIGSDSVIYLDYSDTAGREYSYEKLLHVSSYTPWKIRTDDKLVETTKELVKAIKAGFKAVSKRR